MLAPYRCLVAVVKLLSLLHAPTNESVNVQGLLTGSDAQETDPGCYEIWSLPDWERAWGKYTTAPLLPGADPRVKVVPDLQGLPYVDFSSQMVIALFGGLTSGVQSYQLLGCKVENHRVFIRFAPVSDGASNSTKVLSNPYAFMVMNRIKLPFDVEMRVGFLNQLPVYRSLASFAAPKAN